MHELEPWPEDDPENAFRDRLSPRPRTKKLSSPTSSLPRSTQPSAASDGWESDRKICNGNFGSPPKSRQRPLFAGPPPPIASSVMVSQAKVALSEANSSSASKWQQQANNQSKHGGFGSLLLFEPARNVTQPTYQPDTLWRGLRRREAALEGELQQLLDLQASGLTAGRDGGVIPTSNSQDEYDSYSDTGSSTPTGTFYSTATSKSRMMSSLYVPTRLTPDGNVIPARQPRSFRPKGLRAARNGLRRSISTLAQLKAEEEALVDDALAERKKALSHANRLDERRESITAELKSLEEDEEEPLGQELRQMGAQYDGMTKEIHELEEKLIGLHNQRRRLRSRMEDVRNRRDAGLSGYRGALKDVDAQVATLMHRPAVQPLDMEAIHKGVSAGKMPSTGGLEFLRMIPERRTLDMARGWWESEMIVLERRKVQVEDDRLALEEGGALWSKVMQLVSDYEARLRGLMKTDHTGSVGSLDGESSKGNDSEMAKDASLEDMIRDQLPEMEKVMNELEKHQNFAEGKGWNLLICAIGAELEAFGEAQAMLQGILAGEEEGSSQQDADSEALSTQSIVKKSADSYDQHQDHNDESSDNEVPADLLVSHSEHDYNAPRAASPPGAAPKEMESGSENDVPPEFLAEHRDKVD